MNLARAEEPRKTANSEFPMFFNNRIRPQSLNALAEVKYQPFWLDDSARPEPAPALTSSIQADLTVIGAGFTGLWSALLAKQQFPTREVIVLEAGEVASGASGRNGGFVASSLTHGFQNGKSRWRKELPALVELGHRNLDDIEATVKEFKIDCDFLRSGELDVATEKYQAEQMPQEAEDSARYGERKRFLNQEEIRARVHSPSYLAALYDPNVAMVNPARLAWGLKRACKELGVKFYEHTQVLQMEENRAGVLIKTQYGQVESRRVALATNAFPPLMKHLSFYIVPVYDYVLTTEPLSAAQRDSIGWKNREGIGDGGNQFHYYRTTEDGRILWGGYDAVYYRNNGVAPQLENHPQSFAKLSEHFFQTFPQLSGLKFSHAWGGVIDTCSRYSVFWGTAFRGKLSYALGYTGLGVGASRFGALTMLDLLEQRETERTALQMTRQKPFPFPPEPFRAPIINFTRWSLNQADENMGRRNLWLKILDALKLGFDS